MNNLEHTRPESINEKDSEGNTKLHKAITKEDEAEVRFLISEGAEVNIKNRSGMTPLNLLFFKYKQDIRYDHDHPNFIINTMNILLDAGATIHDETEIEDPLISICDSEDISHPEFNKRILIDKKKVINTLLEKGANINTRNALGDTPLINAIIQLYEPIIRSYINNYFDEYDDYYDSNRDEDEEDLHLPRDEDVEIARADYINHYVDLIKFLISKGADVSQKNKKGETAFDKAKKKDKNEKQLIINNEEVVNILIEARNAKIQAEKRKFYETMVINKSDPSKNSFNNLLSNRYLLKHIAGYAYGEEEKSDRGDAGRRRKKSVRKKSKSKRKKCGSKKRKCSRKKSKSKRNKSKSKRRKSRARK